MKGKKANPRMKFDQNGNRIEGRQLKTFELYPQLVKKAEFKVDEKQGRGYGLVDDMMKASMHYAFYGEQKKRGGQELLGRLGR